MICPRCGTENTDEFAFCTECGCSLTEKEISRPSGEVQEKKEIKIPEFLTKINAFIDKYSGPKLNVFLSLVSLVSIAVMRILGSLFTAVLVTLVNGYLVFGDYKKNSKINVKMCIWSAAVLILGIIAHLI